MHVHPSPASGHDERGAGTDSEHSEPYFLIRHFPDDSESADEVRVITHLPPSSAVPPSTSASSARTTVRADKQAIASQIEAALIGKQREVLRQLFTAHPGLVNTPLPGLNSPPLVAAVRIGQRDIVKDLIDIPGIHVDARDGEHRNAIHAACESGSLELARLLVSHGASLHTHCKGSTPLIAACLSNNPALLDYLLSLTVPRQIDFWSPGGKTALVHSIECGHFDAVKKLIAHGANPNLLISNAVSPLHVAAERGQLAIAQFLIRHGATAMKASDGYPLDRAIRAGDLPMVELLLKTPPVTGEWRVHALAAAITAGQVAMLNCLLAHGVSPDTMMPNGVPLLAFAADFGRTEAVALLLAHGANARHRSAEGHSALSRAIKVRRSRDLILLLLCALPEKVVLEQPLAQALLRRARRREDYRILNELATRTFEDGAGKPYSLM